MKMKRAPLASTTALLVILASGSARAQEPTATPWSGEGDWDIPGEIVVDFKDDVAKGGIDSLLRGLGVVFRPTALEEDTRIEIVSIDPARGSAALASALKALQADPRVEHVEPLARVRAMFVPDDPMYRDQWHLRQIGSESAWTWSVGRGATVAVVDTGIACETIDDFKKASDLGSTRCVAGYNFVANNDRASDDQGHGTHVAGTIAQSTHNSIGVAGLAFQARLMPVKVLSADGWGTTTAVADGIRWAADHGAQVINLSLGGPRNSWVLQAAIDHARSRGATVVAAAGNNGGAIGYPGGSRGVIGVAATDSHDGLAPFSARGKGIDIAAPGVGVTQQTICDRGRNGCELFKSWSGTSMASPHVAAAAALLVSLGITDPDRIEHHLRSNARKLDADREGTLMGAGLVQSQDAVWSATTTLWITRIVTLLATMALAFAWAKKKGREVKATSAGLWLGAIPTGVGLFLLPLVAPRHHWAVDLFARPVGEWDLLIGASLHSFLPLASFLVPLGLSALLLGMPRARPWLAGVAIGSAGYMASIAIGGHLHTRFGWFLTTAWCALNALASTYLGSLLLRKRN
jgi:serine protease